MRLDSRIQLILFLSITAFAVGLAVYYHQQNRALSESLSASEQEKAQLQQQYQQSLDMQQQLVSELEALPQPSAPVTLDTADIRSGIEQLYNPEEQSSEKGAKLDALKKRFENILVLHFYLRECKKTGNDDFFIIMASLGQEMASFNAPGRLQYDIITAAQGTYREVYAKSDCNQPQNEALLKQYSDYITALSQNALVP